MINQPKLTSNILCRVFCIGNEHGSQVGTGFAIEVNNRQFLVTADHVAQACEYRPSILLKNNDQWVPYKTTWELTFNDQESDVAVLEPATQICSPDLHITLGAAGLAFGTVGFALGFPGVIDVAHLANQPWGTEGQPRLPLPLHTLVPIYLPDSGKDIYCSGYLTPGYSGGPIIAPKENVNNGWMIVGVCTKLTQAPVGGNAQIPTGVLVAANIHPILTKLEAL